MTDRVIRVVVDPSGVTRGANQAGRSLDRLEGRSRGLTTGFKAAAAAAAAFAASLVVREIIQAVDAYQALQNRLRVVTDSTAELTSVQESLFRISQESRTSFEATAELYSRAAIAANELGASQEDLLRLTEISGKALAIQGSSAAEAAGALRQLSQSFSSGIVRAEEFNSILEGAFPLAQAAARGIDEAGGSVGRLRQLVVEGEISSREFFEAILEGGEQIDDQFGATEATIGQALTAISNSFLNLVGSLNDASGAGATVAGTLLEVSRTIDTLTAAITGSLRPTDELSDGLKIVATGFVAVGLIIENTATIIDATLGQALRSVIELFSSLGAAIAAVVSGEFSRLPQIFAELGEDLATGFQENTLGLGDELAENVTGAAGRIRQIWDETTREIIEANNDVNDSAQETNIVPPNAAEDIAAARDAIAQFQQSLQEQTGALALQAAGGDNVTESLIRYRESLQLAAAENEIFGDLLPTAEVEAFRQQFIEAATQQLDAQRQLRAEIANEEIRQSFDEQIEALEQEIFLLDADSEAIARNAELRALAGGATAEQAARIRELTEELERERAAGDEASDNFTQFLTDARGAAENQLSGILADPLNEGLDELPFKFAQLLQQLAAEALAAEVFDILGGLGGGGAGGGGIGSLIGGFFGGGFQSGGQVRGGQPILVGERGPELFAPPSSGNIVPNVNINQAAQSPPVVNVTNVTDPADIPSGLNSAEGQEAVLNIIQRNPDAVKRVLG